MKNNKLSKTTYIANGIEVLLFSNEPDAQGSIIPPEAHATFPKTITVTYGEEDDEYEAGKATLRRVGNMLLADLILKSDMKDPNKALKLMSKMTPAVSFYIKQHHEETILELEICEVFLTNYTNDNLGIKPLGNRVQILPKKQDLH